MLSALPQWSSAGGLLLSVYSLKKCKELRMSWINVIHLDGNGEQVMKEKHSVPAAVKGTQCQHEQQKQDQKKNHPIITSLMPIISPCVSEQEYHIFLREAAKNIAIRDLKRRLELLRCIMCNEFPMNTLFRNSNLALPTGTRRHNFPIDTFPFTFISCHLIVLRDFIEPV